MPDLASLNSPSAGWIVLGVVIVIALAVDLVIFGSKHRALSLREALLASAGWVSLALLFNAFVFATQGAKPGLEFLTGYLIELSLSVDNLFVFLLLFRYFAVPPAHQREVLFWGILGAVVFRLAFIFAGVALLQRFHFLIYIFGLILIFSGVRMWAQDETEMNPEKNPVLRLLRRFLPITPTYEDGKFLVRRGGLWATPLFVVLVMVETTDLVFAVDSIPAVLAITRDPFIVFSSNVFAILGLRALFFSLQGVMGLFHYLHYGLAFILVFVGVKMVLSDVFHLPTPWALAVVGGTLALCVVLSLMFPRRQAPPAPTAADSDREAPPL